MNTANEILNHYKEDIRPFAEDIGIDIDYLINNHAGDIFNKKVFGKNLGLTAEEKKRRRVSAQGTWDQNKNFIFITFYTLKDGGRSAVWKQRLDSDTKYKPAPRIIRRDNQSQEAKNNAKLEFKRKLNRDYIDAYKRCRFGSDDCASHRYAEFKGISDILRSGIITDARLMTETWGDRKGQQFIGVTKRNADNEIVALERIYSELPGDKMGTPGSSGLINGAYNLIGAKSIQDLAGDFYLAEGWLDGVIAHILTGIPVLACFSAGNFGNVIEMLLSKGFDKKRMTVLVDNDHAGLVNAGHKVGFDISYNYRIKVRSPDFTNYDLNDYINNIMMPQCHFKDKSKITDFSDLFLIDPDDTALQIKKSCFRAPSTKARYSLEKLKYLSPFLSQDERNKIKSEKIFFDNGRRIKDFKDPNLKSVIKDTMKMGWSDQKIKAEIIVAIYGLDNSILTDISSFPYNDDFLAKNDKNELEKGIARLIYILNKAVSRARYAVNKRVSRSHMISKDNPNLTYKKIPMIDASHGGKVIDPEFGKIIKDWDGIVVVRALMGSGKSEMLGAAMSEVMTGVIMSHRILLSKELAKRLGLKCYKDTEHKKDVADKMTLCVNSLAASRFDHGNKWIGMDIFGIDEFTKVIQHMTGSTITDPEKVADTLTEALKTAKNVTICDADINDDAIDLLTDLTGRKILVCDTEVKKTIYVDMGTAKEALRNIKNNLLSGKKVLVACDAQKDVKKLTETYKDSFKVLEVHADTKDSPEVKSWILDPNNESKKYDAIFYNGSVDSGISITINHFDVMIGLFRGVVRPSSIPQIMGRDRTKNKWFVGCSPINFSMIGLSAPEKYNARVEYSAFLEDKFKAEHQITNYDKMLISVEKSEQRERKDYYLTLATLFEQKGYHVTQVEDSTDAYLVGKEFAKLGREIKEKMIASLESARVITQEEYQFKKAKDFLSADEKILVDKYELCDSYAISDAVPESFVKDDWAEHWLENKVFSVLRFEILQSDLKDLEEFDRWDASNKKSVTLRKYLSAKGRIYHQLFKILGVNLTNGSGEFNHATCKKFIDWLNSDKLLLDQYNLHNIGPAITQKFQPKCPTKFVQKILEKMGLFTVSTKKGIQRLAVLTLCEQGWRRMLEISEFRKNAGKNVAHIPSLAEVIDFEVGQNNSLTVKWQPEVWEYKDGAYLMNGQPAKAPKMPAYSDEEYAEFSKRYLDSKTGRLTAV